MAAGSRCATLGESAPIQPAPGSMNVRLDLKMPALPARATTPAAALAVSVLAVSVLMLAACGGGGGGSSPPETPNQLPVAAARVSGQSVLQTATVFDTTGSADPDGSIASSSWNYGDGQTGTAASHVYTTSGAFTAVYTVTDNRGAQASASVQVQVAKCSTAGTAAASLSPFTSVCMQTSRGEIVIEVYQALAPATAANFLRYVDDGFYTGLLFHRVIPGFVIQAGGFVPGPTAKTPTYGPIALESNNTLKNWQYTLAMARTSVVNSATSQFYVNLVDNHQLDYNPAVAGANGYAVFGLVIHGTAAVEGIGTVATTTRAGMPDVPVDDVLIRSVVRMP